jgi:Na+-transporting methylmalonyl-CoA/oxaloacetate decarboxylase gamma subunit
MASKIPSQFLDKGGNASTLGVGLFALTTFVLIYQIYFYSKFIKNLESNSDLEERVARLERLNMESTSVA